jgi:hypothetical protein
MLPSSAQVSPFAKSVEPFDIVMQLRAKALNLRVGFWIWCIRSFGSVPINFREKSDELVEAVQHLDWSPLGVVVRSLREADDIRKCVFHTSVQGIIRAFLRNEVEGRCDPFTHTLCNRIVVFAAAYIPQQRGHVPLTGDDGDHLVEEGASQTHALLTVRNEPDTIRIASGLTSSFPKTSGVGWSNSGGLAETYSDVKGKKLFVKMRSYMKKLGTHKGRVDIFPSSS